MLLLKLLYMLSLLLLIIINWSYCLPLSLLIIITWSYCSCYLFHCSLTLFGVIATRYLFHCELFLFNIVVMHCLSLLSYWCWSDERRYHVEEKLLLLKHLPFEHFTFIVVVVILLLVVMVPWAIIVEILILWIVDKLWYMVTCGAGYCYNVIARMRLYKARGWCAYGSIRWDLCVCCL